MRLLVCACVMLASCFLGNAQFLGSIFGRRHPMYERRFQQAEDMLLMSALFGIDLNDRMLWNVISGGGGGAQPGPSRRPVGRGMARRDPFASTLQTLGFIDGPDNPDGRAAPAGPRTKGAAPAAAPEAEGAAGGAGGEEAPPAKRAKPARQARRGRKKAGKNRKKPAGRG